MKTIHALFLLFFFFPLVHAQHLEEKDYMHNPRPGDNTVKREIAVFNPGKGGKDCFWDMSKLKVSDGLWKTDYFLRLRTLTASEGGRLYSYRLAGDSLLLTQEEDPLNIVRYSEAPLLMKFPLDFDSQSFSRISGQGKYCDRIEIGLEGMILTEVDGEGSMILPGGDTLNHVVRVHITKKITDQRSPLPTDFKLGKKKSSGKKILSIKETTIETDLYQWYAEGYRYPVLERGEIRTHSKREPSGKEQYAYLYHPDDQRSQLEDPLNEAYLAYLDKLEGKDPGKGKGKNPKSLKSATGIPEVEGDGIRIYPNPVSDVLQVQASEARIQEVEVLDITGKVVYRTKSATDASALSISTTSWTKGTYLVRIVSNAGVKIEKIVKL